MHPMPQADTLPTFRDPLPASRLYTRCDPELFAFRTTTELAESDVVVGQAIAIATALLV